VNRCLIESDMRPTQALVLVFVLVVIALTLLRAGRLGWWMRRASSAKGLMRDASEDRLFARATLFAHSTRGLARTAVWLVCATGAAGMQGALVMEQSTRFTLVREQLEVVTDVAKGLGLCALLFAAALAFDLVAARASRNLPLAWQARERDASTRPVTLGHYARLGTGFVPIVLVSGFLANLGSMQIVVSGPERTMRLYDQHEVWAQIAYLLFIIGVLNWLTTLFRSALLRPRVSVKHAAAVSRQ
jgi:hypothetical protein